MTFDAAPCIGRDVFVVERNELREAENASVKVAPRVHLAPADVSDAVIDELQIRLARGCDLFLASTKPGAKIPR